MGLLSIHPPPATHVTRQPAPGTTTSQQWLGQPHQLTASSLHVENVCSTCATWQLMTGVAVCRAALMRDLMISAYTITMIYWSTIWNSWSMKIKISMVSWLSTIDRDWLLLTINCYWSTITWSKSNHDNVASCSKCQVKQVNRVGIGTYNLW